MEIAKITICLNFTFKTEGLGCFHNLTKKNRTHIGHKLKEMVKTSELFSCTIIL